MKKYYIRKNNPYEYCGETNKIGKIKTAGIINDSGGKYSGECRGECTFQYKVTDPSKLTIREDAERYVEPNTTGKPNSFDPNHTTARIERFFCKERSNARYNLA